MKRETNKIRFGFTLVELLTTLAVIGILLGLLIPALNQVSKTAAKVKQKAQFHAIGTALETFRNDYGDYPPSMYNQWGAMTYVTASHHLAEALVGRDGLGFHQASQFWSDGKANIDSDVTPDTLYNSAGYTTSDGTPITTAQNLAARKGPYLELENANAVKLGNIYPVGLANLNKDAYVLADMYKIVKNTATGKEVGMPILYYKANKLKIGNDPDPAQWGNNTYNIDDSFLNDMSGNSLGIIGYPAGLHPLSNQANASIFYNAIANPNFTSPVRPYRAESFLLHSAGPDGLYGTIDDMFNFDQDN
jgi:prepilin-type N-terminal cleavage/methylation domain-containing protein